MKRSPQVGEHAAMCFQTLRKMKPSARKLPPSTIEIAVREK